MIGGLEKKIKKFGFFKKASLIAGMSLLALLAFGCSQTQYRARIQTVPKEEIKIYINGKYKGTTSKKEPVYVESDSHSNPSLTDICKISLKANKYDAHFIMRYSDKTKIKDKFSTINYKGRSKNCLMAAVTKWEKGLSYNLMFRIPLDLLEELHKPEKRYTEWGDEIKEDPKNISEKKEPYAKPAEPIKPAYIKPEPKKPYTKPIVQKPKESALPIKKPEISTDIGKLVDEIKPVEFFASLGIGNSFGGFGASGGALLNLGKIPSIELFASLGYLFFSSNSELNTVAVEGGATLHFKYFNNWSWYLKAFGGISGKEVRWVGSTKVDETTLFDVGLIGGHRFMIKDTFFILTGGGFSYGLNTPEWAKELEVIYAFEIGMGVKF